MKKSILQNIKKTFFLLLIFGILIGLNFGYNQKRETSAQEKEEQLTNCKYVEPIDLPHISQKEHTPLTENVLEIPIGRATEKIEEVSKMIINTMPILTVAAAREAQLAVEMSALIEQCGDKDFGITLENPYGYACEPHCDPEFDHWNYSGGVCAESKPADRDGGCGEGFCPGGSCPDEYHPCAYYIGVDEDDCPDDRDKKRSCATCGGPCPSGQICCCKKVEKDCYCIIKPVYKCVPSVCTGPACPEGIGIKLFGIIDEFAIIRSAYKIIADPFTPRFDAITLYEMQYHNNRKLDYYIDVSEENLQDELIAAGWNPNTPISGLDNLSKQFCYNVRFRSPWNDLCSSPVELEVEDNLEKSKNRLFQCVLRSSEEEDIDELALEMEYTGLLSCFEVRTNEIPISSFLNLKPEHYYIYESDLKLVDECFGNEYCRAEEKSGPCAEDYFCCQ